MATLTEGKLKTNRKDIKNNKKPILPPPRGCYSYDIQNDCKNFQKMRRITIKPGELLIIDCLDNYQVFATAENFDRIIDEKQIKIDCRLIKE
jgi:hypothetical protein